MKKIWAMLTALALVCAMLPSAMAVEREDDNPAVQENKTATPLDTYNQTDVTLTIGSGQEKDNVAVLFVLDYSTSVSVRSAAASMLKELANKKNTNIKACVINYWAEQDNGIWTSITANTDTDALLRTEQSGGTNLHGGLLAAQKALEDPEIAGYETYLVLISDGITYLWTDETSGDTQCVWYQQGATGEYSIQNGNSVIEMKYPDPKGAPGNTTKIPENVFEDLVLGDQSIVEKYNNTLTYAQECIDVNAVHADEPYISFQSSWKDDEGRTADNFLIGTEIAIYKSAGVFAELSKSVDHVFTLKKDEGHWGQYPYGEQLMDYLIGQSNKGSGEVTDETATTVFDTIEDKILYEIQRGTVTDVISPYFNLTSVDSFIMKRGGETLKGSVSTENPNVVTFDKGNYVVTYDPEEESFTWEIKVPVELGASISLTYTLTLDEAAVDDAVKEGTITRTAIPTNESAKLIYTSTDGDSGEDNFPVPTVNADKGSQPSMDKTAEGQNGEIGTVETGDAVQFTLSTTLPQRVGDVDRYDLVFYDTMSGLSFNNDVAVFINGEELNKEYYQVSTNTAGYTFTVTMDLISLLNDGVITTSQMGTAPVKVTYSATVTATAGDVSNTAQVNNSNVDTITGTVPGAGTGGSGTLMFTLGGAALLAAAGVLFVVNRRKAEN